MKNSVHYSTAPLALRVLISGLKIALGGPGLERRVSIFQNMDLKREGDFKTLTHISKHRSRFKIF
jgi:hypothetical protein